MIESMPHFAFNLPLSSSSTIVLAVQLQSPTIQTSHLRPLINHSSSLITNHHKPIFSRISRMGLYGLRRPLESVIKYKHKLPRKVHTSWDQQLSTKTFTTCCQRCTMVHQEQGRVDFTHVLENNELPCNAWHLFTCVCPSATQIKVPRRARWCALAVSMSGHF